MKGPRPAAGRQLTQRRLVASCGLVVASVLVLVAVSPVAVDVMLIVQTVAALVFTVAAARRSRLQPGRGWVALAVFGAAWFISRAGALALDPDPTLAGLGQPLEVIWIVGVPCGLFGIYRQAFGGLGGRTALRVLSDALVVALALMLVSWVTFHQITLGGPDLQPGIRLLVPALELLGASLVLTAAVYQPARRHLRWWVAASFASVVGDVSLAHQVMTGRPVGGPVVLACFVLTPVLLVGMVLTPDAPDDQVEPDRYAVTSAHRELLTSRRRWPWPPASGRSSSTVGCSGWPGSWGCCWPWPSWRTTGWCPTRPRRLSVSSAPPSIGSA